MVAGGGEKGRYILPVLPYVKLSWTFFACCFTSSFKPSASLAIVSFTFPYSSLPACRRLARSMANLPTPSIIFFLVSEPLSGAISRPTMVPAAAAPNTPSTNFPVVFIDLNFTDRLKNVCRCQPACMAGGCVQTSTAVAPYFLLHFIIMILCVMFLT